ncbi:GAF domain-containing protein [Pseudonocardia sulfidoxydans]|uniref:GAF domain-containing protein n=1 Tax=Pseudonocardia sulfidoxydans TaxID=54011 RepID=UPI0011BD6071|nr:GAF domain-containing protein [Pseudonocardia sulfidoxydans]
MLANDPTLIGLALQVGRTRTAQLDVGALVSGVCGALPMAVGVAGAVIVFTRAPDPLTGPVFASDPAANRLGELQHRRAAGPVQEAIATGCVVVTADLTRSESVEVAAVAAETGLASAVTVPIALDGRTVAALQLLGTGFRPVPGELAETVRPLVEALSARLSDASGFGRLSAAVARSTAALESGLPLAHATGILAERYRTDVEEAGRFLAGAAARAALPVEVHAAAVVAEVGRRDGTVRRDAGPRDDMPTDTPPPVSGEVPVPRDASTGRRHRRDDAGPLAWLAGDLPLPRHSRARREPRVPRRPEHGDARATADTEDGDGGPGSPRHRRADIS